MTPEIMIDAYNLIHRSSDLKKHLDKGLEAAREELIHQLISFRSNKKIKITVVFDGDRVGQPSKMDRHGIRIHFSVPPKKADQVIKTLLKKRKNPRNITVISSDNEIIGFARTCGAQTMRSEEFYKKYFVIEEKYDSPDSEKNMSEAELQHWLQLFNEPREE